MRRVPRSQRSLSRPRANPDRKAAIVGAIGVGTVVGTLAWWYLRDTSTPNNKGQILCPRHPYDATIRDGDFVVIELQSRDKLLAEPTWAEVVRVTPWHLTVRIAGEASETTEPKPLATDKHGYKINDIVRIAKTCVYDRFRPGQAWQVICGPALLPTGYAPIERSRASLLTSDDRALVIVADRLGQKQPLWVSIGNVSSGQQVISGTVIGQPDLEGVAQGDLLEFLRDCIVDAEYGVEA